jgi:serine protease Do/serine protease DegQ
MKLPSPSSFAVPVLLLALGTFWLGAENPPAPATAPNPSRPVLKVDGSPIGPSGPGGLVTSYADIIEPVQKAVVSVYSTKIVHPGQGTGLRGLGGGLGQNPGAERRQEGLGSGVIISPNGYILTNNHVVEGADELSVTLTDDREFKARVMGADDKTDVAVIKIEADNLPIATMADSDKLRVGDIVFAIGNPLGVGQTVTNGIISATGRTDLNLLDNVRGGYENFIQTDAAINMGNSGGALVDARGRLVAINSAIISPSEGNIGIGFAIPVNLAASIMRSLIENNGKVVRGYLGVGGDTVTAELARTHQLPKETKGVLVTDIPPTGPAGRAGLKPNDVIIAISDHPIASIQDLRLTVAQMVPNSTAGVRLLRDGKETTIKVGLAELPNNELLTGVTVTALTALEPEERTRLNMDKSITNGLIITDISRSSPYVRQLVTGVVIVGINKTPVSDVDAARKLLHPGDNEMNVYYRRTIQAILLNVR